MLPRSLRRICGSFHIVMPVLALGGATLRAQYDSPLDRPPPPPSLDGLRPLSETNRLQPVLVYFPPMPPPLETGSARVSETRVPAQIVAEASSLTGEIFYPQLAGRIDRDTLTKALRQRVVSYQSERMALRQELWAELKRVQGQEATPWREALEALAKRQAPRLAKLEAQAEELRRDLREAETSWGEMRRWQLSKPEDRGFTPRETAMVMLGAAFYYPNLTIVQRGLLRELAYELMQADTLPQLAAVTGDVIKDAGAYRFFSPELARIRKPQGLPAAALEAWAAYEEQKGFLKKELYDTVSAIDKASLSLRSNGELKALAERQGPALAALEAAAERFRRLLPARYGLERPNGVLSAALARRALTWNLARDALRREIRFRGLDLMMPYISRIQLSPKFDEHVLTFDILPTGGRKVLDLTPAERMALSRDADALAAEYAKRYAPLAEERDAIHTEIARAIGSTQSHAVRAAFEAGASEALTNLGGEREDYRAAVYEPGLSAAQRRLLFSAAVQDLELPLPSGERQPTVRAAALLPRER